MGIASGLLGQVSSATSTIWILSAQNGLADLYRQQQMRGVWPQQQYYGISPQGTVVPGTAKPRAEEGWLDKRIDEIRAKL